MLLNVAAAALAALSVAQQTDTIISVRSGARLEVDNFAGKVDVRTWDRSAVRVVADHSSLVDVDIDYDEGTLSLSASGRQGPPARVDYQITVPAPTPVDISGVYTEVSVAGVRGDVSVETVQGDIRVEGGAGYLSLSTVEGAVDLRRTSGRIEVSAVNQGIQIADASGDITAETINGGLRLERVESGNVEASTVNGEVIYDGALRDGGRYHFSTHNGDVSVAVPPSANVTVSVETYNGDFHSSFPVSPRERHGGQSFTVTQGSGSARLDLESFQGRIDLRRPGEAAPADESGEASTPAPPRPPALAKPPRAPRPPAPARPTVPPRPPGEP